MWEKPLKKSSATPLYISYEGSDTNRVAELAGRIAAERRALARRQHAEAQRKLNIEIQKAFRTDVTNFADPHKNSFVENVESTYGSGSTADRFGGSFKISKSLELIWQRIRSRIGYRSEHILSRIAGDVKIGIRVNKKGKLLNVLESEAEGDRRLLGWVLLCLIDAFRDPFEHLYLDGNVTLDLRFHFSLGDPVPEPEAGLRMVFPIVGDTTGGLIPRLATGNLEGLAKDFSSHEDKGFTNHEIVLLTVSTDRIVNFFKDKKLRNRQEWDFYAQEENYKHHCDAAKNSQGCMLLAGLYKSIGKYHDSNRYEQLARDYEARRNSIDNEMQGDKVGQDASQRHYQYDR